jgi:putative heme-binding domain-containing protein
MIFTKLTRALGIMVLMSASVIIAQGVPSAQDRAAGTPQDADQAAVRTGGALFRERCAECHGSDAKGITGHDLTRLWTSGATDERVFQTIRSGVPNTIMPSSSAPDEELRSVVRYLRSLNDAAIAGPAAPETSRGTSTSTSTGVLDINHGEAVFWSTCGGCHAVNGRGGRLGPDFTRIGPTQSREALIRAIRAPVPSAAGGYQAVTLVTRDGQRIRGAMKSEDAFSIQIMDTHEQLQGYLKARLREVIREPASLMPAFGADRLTDRDLDDLVAFLNTRRGSGPGPGAGRGRGR